MKHIIVVADFLDVPIDYLTAKSENPISWKIFKNLYERYCKLSAEDQELYIRFLQYINERRNEQ